MSHLTTIRILLVDDHEVVRRGLEMLLSIEPDIQILGEASDGAQAVERARALKPDLVLLDIKMPGMTGIQAARAIKQASAHTRVLILSGVDVDHEIMSALEADVDGYVLKDAPAAELLHAIHVVAGGQAYLQPAIARRLLRKLAAGPSPPGPTAPQPEFVPPAPPQLTPRELDVLKLMATSSSNREIAMALTIGEETVRTHIKSILHKLGQPTRTQAVMAALRLHLIELD